MTSIAHRLRREDGFTLPEILAVIVILSILASFTYVMFLGQDKSALDAEAKSNARSLMWKVQTCFTAREDYTLCDEPSEQEPPPGVKWGPAPGEVQVVTGAPDTTRYHVTIRALSRAETDGANHSFTLARDAGEKDERTCVTDSTDNNAGGCSNGTW